MTSWSFEFFTETSFAHSTTSYYFEEEENTGIAYESIFSQTKGAKGSYYKLQQYFTIILFLIK